MHRYKFGRKVKAYMERTILFSGTKTKAAARFAFNWVCEKGGTFIMPNRTVLLKTIGVTIDPRLKTKGTFERTKERYLKREKPVSLDVTSKNGYMAIGPRVAISNPNDDILVDLEAQMNTKDYREYMQEMLICIQSPRAIAAWAEYYFPMVDPRGYIPESWQELLDDNSKDVDIPSDIEDILAEAARNAAGEPTGRFHIDMVNSLKYDIDVNWNYWKAVSARSLERGCSRAGITLADAKDLLGWFELKGRGSAPARPSIKPVDYSFMH